MGMVYSLIGKRSTYMPLTVGAGLETALLWMGFPERRQLGVYVPGVFVSTRETRLLSQDKSTRMIFPSSAEI